MVKKEYRGQRTADAMADFVAEQLKDPLETIQSIDEVNKAKVSSGVKWQVWTKYLHFGH